MLLRVSLAGAALFCALAGSSLPGRAAGSDAPASAVPFSSDPGLAAEQRGAYNVVHRYEQLLNAGDTAGILALYAPDGVAEWNDKPTFATPDEKRAAYGALFKVANFSTAFGYAGIDVTGDTAVIRTFHHEGATVLEGGKKVVDLNREVFVLHKIRGAWKISLYIFNTDPVQGEG
ncbi:nuclear transport factor 2 family protein [Lichenihabitans sp. Uapishka_5]|uniref:YybH family protein n=1 Tax=Lichenihabitans sp. Uapishka_5 TaxID=3037302 RepID=UPI0029E7D35A|nr:nuclear transport factor 2 family protein [Lichenihabitans sp. Uapishka_5]MDX7953590.1 nuclear transport factor 2 family protein [Lichenihabitans sp. Uapishka_5]